jgi:glycosyltransferase involved in cell wall biosynthesis
MPLFSIIIPTYNRAFFIGRCINSVLSQQFTDFEIIVVDDGSTDNTNDIVENYNDSRLFYDKKDKNGVSSARNYGVNHASGAWLLFLDSDDILSDNALFIWNREIQNNKNHNLIFSSHVNQYSDKQIVVYPKPLGRLYQNQTGLFTAGSFVVKKDIFKEVGGFDEKIVFGENYELGLRLFNNPNISIKSHYINDVTTIVTIHENSSSNRSISENKLLSMEIFIEKHFLLLKKQKRLYHYYRIAGVLSRKIKKKKKAIQYLIKSIYYNPFQLKTFYHLLISI